MKNCHLFKHALVVILLLTTFNGFVFADETGGTGDHSVIISGQFSHSKIQDTIVTGAPFGQDMAFHQEIYGQEFNLTVSNLAAGKYTTIIGLVENHFNRAGQRIFDITCGSRFIARNLDIFAAAGGKGKVYYLTNELDLAGGSLTLDFVAHENLAKFNTFKLENASGNPMVFISATNLIPVAEDPAALKIPVVAGPELWKDASQPLDVRVNDLVSRLSLAEKVSQLSCEAPAIPRLGIPAYNYRNESLHGLQPHAGFATVFPQAIGMAATWDTPLIKQEADVIATEARATHNDYIAKHNGESIIHFGLNFYAPNINIFRDPRWGRGQETYGEDPFLTAQTGVAFISGLQGDDPKYFKAIACAKHFAVHSGPEFERHRFDVTPPERDLYETYLPAFEAAVREGHVNSVMGAYSSLAGVPDCANSFLLTDLLRKQWGFQGFVVSDGGAIFDINNHHKFVPTAEAAAAAAVKAGDDLCSGGGREYYALTRAVKQGLISETEINTAVRRGLKARFQLGIFDPPEAVPFARIDISQNDTAEHAALALKIARESIVLLKNNGVLPLDRAKLRRILVLGASANSVPVLLGNYHGEPSHPITILDGIKAVAGPNIEVDYEPGCPLVIRQKGTVPDAEKWTNAITTATRADAVVYVGGLNTQLEGEEMKVDLDGFYAGDRTRIELPLVQTRLLQALQATGKPIIFVNCSGSAVAMPWEVQNLPAIVQAWYPGEQGGRAVAEILFGDVNPSGRLPITFYNSTGDLPAFDDYSMANRTYRYFTGRPEYAFGHGLSYTKFDYRTPSLNAANFSTNRTVKVSFVLRNSGVRTGAEVVQVYFRHLHSAVPQPKLALCGFARIALSKDQATNVTMDIPAERFRYWDVAKKQYVIESGDYELLVGGASDDIRLKIPFAITAAP